MKQLLQFSILFLSLLLPAQNNQNQVSFSKFANKCMKILDRTTPSGSIDFLVDSDASNSYHITQKADSTFLFFNKSKKMLSYSPDNLSVNLQPSSTQYSSWIIEIDSVNFPSKGFYIKNLANQYITKNLENNGYSLTIDKQLAIILQEEADEDCWYKKVDLGVVENTTQNKQTAKNYNQKDYVWGAIDTHTHPFAYSAFGGVTAHGKVFSEDGVEDALESCIHKHGPLGMMDFYSLTIGGESYDFMGEGDIPFPEFSIGDLPNLEAAHLHHTEGYPEFKSWPAWDEVSHQQYYYEWLNRARYGGLKMMVMYGEESLGYCKMISYPYSLIKPVDPFEFFITQPKCETGEASVQKQFEDLDKLEKFIAEKDGGWLKIVSSPEEARETINSGKFAVLKGIEVSDLFGCVDLISDLDFGRTPCTKTYIKQKLDEVYNQGVRAIYPVHHMNNDFGGSKMIEEGQDILIYAASGKSLDFERCKNIGQGVNPMLTDESIISIFKPLLDFLVEDHLFQGLPDFPSAPLVDLETEPGYCNPVGLKPEGEFLIIEMMKKGMLIDIDHMSEVMRNQVYNLAKKYNYPINSFHLDREFETMMMEMHGANSNSKFNGLDSNLFEDSGKFTNEKFNCDYATSYDYGKMVQSLASFHKNQTIYGFAAAPFSTDLFGGTHLIAPRFENNHHRKNYECTHDQNTKINYPFVSFDKKYVFDRLTSGYRIFDFNHDGMANIGLFPDLIADLQSQGFSDQDIEPIFRGAEIFLQVWENSILAAEDVKKGDNQRTSSLNVTVYPSIVDNRLSLENKSDGNLEISILDSDGRIVKKLNSGSEKNIEIGDVSFLTKGVYFVNVVNKNTNQSKTIKIIKK